MSNSLDPDQDRHSVGLHLGSNCLQKANGRRQNYPLACKELNSWKLNIFKIIDGRISFYCNNLDLLPPKPYFTFRHLKKEIQEFHRKFVLAPADKAANNVVVV